MTMVQIGSSAAPWRALFWASLVLLTACAGDPRDGGGALDAPILTALVARSPEAASWLERAAAAPAVSVGRGADRVFRVSTAHRAEPSPSTARPAGRFRSTERSVTVEIADDGSGAMRVSVAGCPLRVGVRRVGGVGAEAHLEGGAVALRGASPGVDALVFAKEHSVEDLLAAQGPEVSIGYELDLPEGWSLYRPQGFEGLVEIHDAQEIAWLRLWARKGWDRAGREVGIEPVVEGNRVRIRVEEGAEWPVLVDPEFEGTGSMAVLRVDHTATLIANGKVLVAGGRGPASAVLASAELYDPWTQTFTSSKGMMTTPRAWHTATPVPDGRVILAGGWDLPIDAYDSANDTFLPAGQTKFDMLDGTARLLFDGRVLLAGENGLQVYDPSSNIVSLQVTPLLSAHHYTSTRLRNGKVLVIGAWYGGAKPQPKPGPEPYDVPALTQLYDPVTDTSSAAVVIPELHWSSSATLLPNGKVLIVGPSTTFGGDPPPPSAVLYDPDSGEFNLVGTNLLAQSAATLLPDGTVLLLGGQVAQLFDPEGNFKEGGTLAEHRDGATATLLLDGSVLLTGGMDAGQKWLASAELYDATAGSRVKTSKTQRSYQGHTATPLGDGSVLLAGGIDAGDTPVSAAQLYHPMSGQFENAGHLHHVRYDHTATLLPNGEVLFVGGDFPSGGAPSAEVYDPLTKESSDVGALTAGALGHTATPLPSGKVLLAGGTDNQSLQSSLDLYDPATGAFSSAGTMPHPRSAHSATLLPNGKVLFASRSGVDVYDPSTSTWTPSGPMAAPRSDHTAVLLPDGKILFAGGGYTTIGTGMFDPAFVAEIYDPTSGSSEALGLMPSSCRFCRGVLLPSGRVLLAEGVTGASVPFFYIPATKRFVLASELSWAYQISASTLTLLSDGGILQLGSEGSDSTLPRGFIFRDTKVAEDPYRPTITAAPPLVESGASVKIKGTLFTGVTEASGGATNASPTNRPIGVWMPFPQGIPAVGTLSPWSDTEATWTVPSTPFPGRGLFFVVTNGIWSAGVQVVINPSPLASPCAFGPACASGFCADGVCCDTACVGGCFACVGAKKGGGADGTCRPIPEGQDPKGTCEEKPANTCQETGACDGSGHCALQPKGMPCGEGAVCQAGVCLSGGPCGTNGDCAEGFTCSAARVCAPVLIDEIVKVGCAASPEGPTGATPWLLLGLSLAALSRRRGASSRQNT